MKPRQTSILMVLVLAALIFLVYQPVFEPSTLPPVVDESPPADVAGRDRGELLSFCSDVWPPYVNERGSRREGYVVDMLREVYQPLGFKVQLFIVPWSRCLEEVRIGQMTAVIGTDTEEAPELIFPKATMGVYRPLFYTLTEDSWIYPGIDALQKVRLGVVQDYSYSAKLDTYIKDYHQTDRLLFAKGEQPLETLFLALREERIDAFIENEITVNTYLANQPGKLGLIREAGALQADEKMFVAFNPAYERANSLAKHYDDRVDELRKSGLLAALLNNYGLKDWSLKSPYQSLQDRSEEKRP